MSQRPYDLIIFDWNGTLSTARFSGSPNPIHSIFHGVPEMLEHLQAEGYQLAIATAASRQSMETQLEHFNIERYFGGLSCDDDGFSKPDRRVIDTLLEQMQVPAERALMVGDTPMDIECARHAQVDAAAVSNGNEFHGQKLLAYKPLVLLDKVTDLVAWLARKAVV